MTPFGIEPATFRFVAQHLNHCATAVPLIVILIIDVDRVRAVRGEVLVLVVEIAASNSASGIDVCPMSQEEALRQAEH